jgi:hypothetical protein
MTKGLSIYTSIDYNDCQMEADGQQDGKSVFYLIFGYGESKVMSSKVEKLLENYNINSYKYPSSSDEAKATCAKLDEKLANNAKLV